MKLLEMTRKDLSKTFNALNISKLKAETQLKELQMQLKISENEKEKYIASRDKQIEEIKSEMSRLQQVVNELLKGLYLTTLLQK